MAIRPGTRLRLGISPNGYTIDQFGRFHHITIWEKKYGKKKPEYHDIHHVDLNKRNNSIKNLMCLPRKFHMLIHRIMRLENRVMNSVEIAKRLVIWKQAQEKMSVSE